MPFELRPYPTPALRPEGSYLQNAWRQSVYPLARELGVHIELPPVSPQPYTRLAFEGLEFAKERGRGGEFNDRVMRAFFQESQDIGQPDVLVRLAQEVDLPADEFRSALERREYSGQVEQLLRHAREEAGVTGVPLFVIGKRKLVGVQRTQRLVAAIEEAGM